MKYVLDAQGFQLTNNEFIVKELAIVPLNLGHRPAAFLFKPPLSWHDLPARYKSINLWLERNHHHLSWSSGDLPYDEVETILRSMMRDASVIYVKGEQKKRWLEQFGFNVREFTPCPSLKMLNTEQIAAPCYHHQRNLQSHCALRNVILLEKFLRDNTPSIERSLTIFYRTGLLSFMEPQDIAQLPRNFIINFAANSVELAWDKLPESLKQDPAVAACLRCREHGLIGAPMKRECIQCRRQ